MFNEIPLDKIRELFSLYMKVTDIPRLEDREEGDPSLRGKNVGIINGGDWTSLWSNYFGRKMLPEVRLINVGNQAVQLNFMAAYEKGLPTPPKVNIEAFKRYALDLIELWDIDVILISCSTMNRSYPEIEKVASPHGIPVVPIDMPMMESAVSRGGRVLVVATHGPTVDNTRKLLFETSERMNAQIEVSGATVEEAFHLLGNGEIDEHNRLIAQAISEAAAKEEINSVVLAQLSMSVFKFSHPNPEQEFGCPVFTSGEEGFRRVRELLLQSE